MGYADSELWKLFKERAIGENKAGLVEAVKQVCEEGEALAGTINQFFPNFTLHNEKHIQNVCNWMIKLLGEEKKNASVRELAMLVMAACCHDIGMAVNDRQKESLRKLAISEVDRSWQQFFEKHPEFYLEFKSSGNVSDEMLRSYVRENHPSRVAEQLKNWSPELTSELLHKNELLELCKSHGFDLSTIGSSSRVVDPGLDLTFCAILLRLSDILDYDASRVPKRLLEFKGLDNPVTEEEKKSTQEWIKSGIGSFHLKDEVLLYSAEFKSPGIEHDINGYLDWVDEELKVCRGYLSRLASRWKEFNLPAMVTRKTSSQDYETGDFHLTMDQDRVLELLSGESLYDKPGVFVRELLQNAIDAVLTRVQLDPTFSEKDGRIDVRTWYDSKDYRYAWFSITDNGIGMDKHAIESYFLKVGRSYYCSDEYKSDIVACGGDSSALPVSRFGIGILSCFMGSPNNQLEVVTRRYSQGKKSNPVYRLSVTGLHDYYVLSQLDAVHHGLTSIRGESINKPLPPEQDNTHEVGTTVYVKVDMYAFGKTDVFRNLLDKYVCFPRVRVIFNSGESDERIYPTHDDLMSKVYALNPDGKHKPLKQYRHPISDEGFERLKNCVPELSWNEKPALVIRYCPLDWLTESGGISGVSISVKLEYENEGRPVTIERDGYSYPGYFYIDINIDDEGNSDTLLGNIGLIIMASTSPEWEGYRFSTLESEFQLSQISSAKNEIEFFGILGVGQDPVGYSRRIAFEGITSSSEKSWMVFRSGFYVDCLLLYGSFRPEMNLSRDLIRDFPLEPKCVIELSRIVAGEDGQLSVFFNFDFNHYRYHPRNDICRGSCEELLDRNPSWIKHLSVAGKPFHQLDEEIEKTGIAVIQVSKISTKNSLDVVSLAHLQAQYGISAILKGWDSELHVKSLEQTEEHDSTGLYIDIRPTRLILEMASFSKLGIIIGDCILINASHPIIEWLNRNRLSLSKDVPALYFNFINSLSFEHLNCKIYCYVFNGLLDSLRSFPNDPFGATSVDYIKVNDFIIYRRPNEHE